MSSGSGPGSGADQHLLALLRAIRLRQAAPDAVAAGAADAAAALTDPEALGRAEQPALPPGAAPEGPPGQPVAVPPRPGWASPRPLERPAPGESAPGESAPGESAPRESAWDGDFGSAATADFFGRPRPAGSRDSGSKTESTGSAGGSVPDTTGPTSPAVGAPRGPGTGAGGLGSAKARTGRPAAASPFDHGPQLRPAGLPPIDPHRRPDIPDSHADASGALPLRVTGLETPAPGRAGAPVDGMDPADKALLIETQRLLSTSLTFAGGPVEVAERFREALLQAQPALLAALPGGPRTQVGQFARGVTWLVHHLDDPPALVAGCRRLGAALAACGVRPRQLHMVGAALAEAMRAGMPPGAWRQDFDLAWRSTWLHAYEWIVHGETTAADEPGIWTAVVVGHELRRHDLAVLTLRPYLSMPLRPGQYARVEVPELPGIWRPYSLAGRSRRDDLLELHVRAKTRSGVSGTLVHRTKVGDHVRLRRAEGEMGLPARPDRNLLMIAGDTGVAPLKAMLAELADTGDPRSAVLFWGVRNLDELYDIAEITEIARAARRATVVPVVSEGDPGPYASGLVTDAVAAYGEWSDHEVYLAGPPLMLAATRAALLQLGVAPERIHHDAPE